MPYEPFEHVRIERTDLEITRLGFGSYERLHAETWPGVLAAIAAANIRNYSIYRHDETLFAYFEYVGDDLEADMAAMAADPTIVEWWALTGAMQVPYPEREPGSWWLTLPEVFHTE